VGGHEAMLKKVLRRFNTTLGGKIGKGCHPTYLSKKKQNLGGRGRGILAGSSKGNKKTSLVGAGTLSDPSKGGPEKNHLGGDLPN